MNTRRLHLDSLRSLDPVMLEILTQEPVRNPITQLSGLTIAEFLAFSEVTDLPKNLRTPFEEFARRVPTELSDLPPPTYEATLAELETVEARFAPHSLREILIKQAELRYVYRDRILELLSRWEATPPEGIELRAAQTIVHKVRSTAVDPSAPRTRAASSNPREPREAAPKVSRAAPVRFVDEVRVKWVQEQALERLSEYMETGLREDVLLTGIRHRARKQYPDLTPVEVMSVLKELAAAGRVRTSAGRWRRVVGSW